MDYSKGKKRSLWNRVLSLVLVGVMVIVGLVLPLAGMGKVAKAAETAITSMAYYSASDGPVLSKSGVGKASFGFVMPIFNGGAATWADVASDLTVNVKVNNSWVNIDDTNFAYNVNWGNWTDSGFNGYWFTISETTYIQLVSKSSGVTLDYTLQFTNILKTTITSMTATQGPVLIAGVTGSIGFTYPTFNGNPSIPYDAVAEDLKVYVKTVNSSEWIDIDNNAASGWIYDKNFGQFTDGGGGYWFTVEESIHVKLESKTSKASLIYTINYSEPVRNSYKITAYDGTSYSAGDTGAIGIPLPRIDGSAPVKSELDQFIYEIKVNGTWVELSDFSKSSFSYSANGYNKISAANQWGYWVDSIYGLWFQPIQVDMEFRIGYPENGQKGGNIGDNYVNYTFIGNPNAVRPDVTDLGNIELGTTEDSNIEGSELIFNDEFNGNQLDTSVWNYNTGYYINDDPSSWGWGNNEMEYYTDSEKNVYLKDGSLNIKAYQEAKSFPQDPNRYAQYSSGKITTKDKFTFKYGRIDFRAKLPTGNGIWPALWMLPNDDTYGTWAASGEIDVMEARGRLPKSTSGTIHFGGQWPANTYVGADYSFPEGQSIDTDYHVYSVVWEEDNIKWYVDGKCFSKITSDQWYSAGAPNDSNAPFDQEFYIIMNLAVGGWFDGGLTPDASDLPATMQVDYVRVYKPAGNGETTTVPVTGMTLDQQRIKLDSIGQTALLSKTIIPSNATNKNVTWISSNPEVAVVDAGQITSVANGTTTITATTKDGGFTSTCVVTVNDASLNLIDVAAGKSVTCSGSENDALAASNLTDGNTDTRWGSNFSDNAWFNIDLGKTYKISQMILNWEAAHGKKYEILVSEDGVNYISVAKQTNGVGGSETVDFNSVNARYVKLQGIERALPYGYSLFDVKVMGTISGNVPVYEIISKGKSVTTSSNENNAMAGSYAVDGNYATRWSSAFTDDQWMIVDLGKTTEVNKVVLNWEEAYGKKYTIKTSMDNINWTIVKEVTNSVGGVDELEFPSVNARYIKLQGIEKATAYGYSLYEMDVYGIANLVNQR